jgi:hypothetical protein
MVEHGVVPALRHQERPVGVFDGKGAEGGGERGLSFRMGQLQVRKLGTAEDEVEVAFDEAGQEGGASAVDDLGRRAG